MLYSDPDSLIHQSEGRVLKYGKGVPGSDIRPNAWVSVKLPAGVLLLPSLAWPTPADPTRASTAPPTGRHPPVTFRHACKVAYVLDEDGATTVITWRASPVERCSGRVRGSSRWAALVCRGGAGFGFVVDFGFGFGFGFAVVRATAELDVGAALEVVGVADVGVGVGVGETGWAGLLCPDGVLPEQAATANARQPSTARRTVVRMPPAFHDRGGRTRRGALVRADR